MHNTATTCVATFNALNTNSSLDTTSSYTEIRAINLSYKSALKSQFKLVKSNTSFEKIH